MFRNSGVAGDAGATQREWRQHEGREEGVRSAERECSGTPGGEKLSTYSLFGEEKYSPNEAARAFLASLRFLAL
ncbi:hypothetical protein MTO96_024222 [Rhipicephalus appendiculatus]